MALTQDEINQISDQVAEQVTNDLRESDILIHGMIEGAIPVNGRENRKKPCKCCYIDKDGPDVPSNRMCTTQNAIGLLNDREEQEWCSEVYPVQNGRCERARTIRTAAKECKEKYPDDTEAFMGCYIPKFSEATK